MMVASDLSLCVLGWLSVLCASLISVLSSCQVMPASWALLISACCAVLNVALCSSVVAPSVACLAAMRVLSFVSCWW